MAFWPSDFQAVVKTGRFILALEEITAVTFLFPYQLAQFSANVDAKFKAVVPSGRYVLYAQFKAGMSIVEWSVRIDATGPAVKIELPNSNARILDLKPYPFHTSGCVYSTLASPASRTHVCVSNRALWRSPNRPPAFTESVRPAQSSHSSHLHQAAQNMPPD